MDSSCIEDIGAGLRARLEAVSQDGKLKQVARTAGVSYRHVINIKAGTSDPTLCMAARVLSALDAVEREQEQTPVPEA